MQTLELEDNIATQLKQVAKQAHLSTGDLIKQLLNKHISEASQPSTLNDFAGILKDSTTFKGDPVEIQRTMRNEWD